LAVQLQVQVQTKLNKPVV